MKKEPSQESAFRGAAMIGAAALVPNPVIGSALAIAGGYSLASSLFDGKVVEKTASSAYKYLYNEDFKKSEKKMKAMFKRNKEFSVNSSALRHVLDIKNKYFKSVATSINRFLDGYDKVKPIIGKFNDYMFDTINPDRDEKIIAELNQKMTFLNDYRLSDMTKTIQNIKTLTPITTVSESDTIIVTGEYLDKLLNIDETFKMINELDNIMEALPSEAEIRSLYNDRNFQRQTEMLGSDCPAWVYLRIINSICTAAILTRDILIHYTVNLYSILNFTTSVD